MRGESCFRESTLKDMKTVTEVLHQKPEKCNKVVTPKPPSVTDMLQRNKVSVTDMLQQGKSLQEVVDMFEKQTIQKALKQCEHNHTDTAKLLKVTRQTLIRKLKKFGL